MTINDKMNQRFYNLGGGIIWLTLRTRIIIEQHPDWFLHEIMNFDQRFFVLGFPKFLLHLYRFDSQKKRLQSENNVNRRTKKFNLISPVAGD